jgi:cytidine deaminase
MKKINIETSITVFQDISELSNDLVLLLDKAIETQKKAYAPYSKFRVGASLLLDNGQIIVGSNQENAAYPSGLCAERVAIYSAGATHPNAKILKMFIVAGSQNQLTDKPIPPCGSCRQSIFEYEFKQDFPIEIYFMGETGQIYMSKSIQNLLPLSFDKNFL